MHSISCFRRLVKTWDTQDLFIWRCISSGTFNPYIFIGNGIKLFPENYIDIDTILILFIKQNVSKIYKTTLCLIHFV